MLRLDLLDLIYRNGGHIGGSLSSLDLIETVYTSGLFDFDQDHFILSAGHLAPALYVVLAAIGRFPREWLNNYSQFGSPLQGHTALGLPGVEYAAGSLGQGLSFAAGLALGNRKMKVICLTTDGEQQEGQIWEAAAFANKYRLNNLINLIDVNSLQIDGSTDEIMPLGSLIDKYSQFGWAVEEIDGHDLKAIKTTLKKAKQSNQPVGIVAHTILGKGISFMENNFKYHDVKSLSQDLYEKARKELESIDA
ncbi:MAG TPA: transketolase [Candidatus Woesebacteria bacterium]|nr:transketolase [Candidatus Woesebacteria bacterium]HRS23252.1 transketolase [Candidatus Woesebacteria bacterium]HRT40037.1 transketolase [Candidatus Woesebacteria bacterium]